MIKIEVTGNSIPEVADKLIAIGRSLHNTAVNDADNAAREAMQAKRDAIMPELREVAKQAPADPTPSEVVSSGETEASPTATSGPEPEAPTTGEPQLDAVRDVQPVVLNAVGKIGKERVAEIVSSFGADRVTQLDADKLPKLVARLEAEMAA